MTAQGVIQTHGGGTTNVQFFDGHAKSYKVVATFALKAPDTLSHPSGWNPAKVLDEQTNLIAEMRLHSEYAQ